MQAYPKTDLTAKYVQEEAREALENSCISSETYNKILQEYPCKLYTPNYFIRIALGLLTVVAVVFSGLLLWLFTSASSTSSITILLIFLAFLCYSALELLVKSKRYYNAGVDNILMAMVIVFIISAFLVSDFETPWLIISSVIMIISLWMCLRFTDAFMAMITCCCFFMFMFLAYLKAGDTAKATAPFLMMAISALVYFVMKKLNKDNISIYRFCLNCVALLTLVVFYASGNYFIVKELSNQMFDLQLTLNDPLPYGWLFWILTFTIPPTYIVYGVIKKDLMVMRTGIGLIAATIFTIKYYYNVLPIEIEMLIAGVLFIAVSYVLIKFLRTPRYGFTSETPTSAQGEALNVEALIIAETFTRQQPNINGPGLYGGGSGGGGGASGGY